MNTLSKYTYCYMSKIITPYTFLLVFKITESLPCILKVQIIDHCDLNDQEARENFWVFHLDTLHPRGLNKKRA